MQKLNRKDLVEIVSEKAHLSKKDARAAIDLVFEQIEKGILEGKEVNITNFGVFSPKKRQQRDGTDPKTHKRITIKETNSVVFRPCKYLKGKLND